MDCDSGDKDFYNYKASVGVNDGHRTDCEHLDELQTPINS